MTDQSNDRTFRQLADDGQSKVRPSSNFSVELRRQLEAALTTPAANPIPIIDLPERKQPAMSNVTAPATQILTPYISVHDGAAALDWYRDAMGATETVRYVGDDGRLGHAEFVVAGARVMLSDAYPEIGVVAATSYEGSSCALHLEVADCDAMHERAVELGAASSMAPTDQPHGARTATIVDPYGHRWMLSQQLTSPSTAEINDAYDEFNVIESD